jgi:hypothetical protein
VTTRRGHTGAEAGAAFRHVVDSLYVEFSDRTTREDVVRAVQDERRRWSAAPVKDFIPILVERSVRARLRD